ncbi:uncharacterized protein LOC122260750 [Penaeus japonicus]|uniref:uncharacterized protein LOC122260750 n=1 Tax=Penaeus japonicus TaxID=27405 RepID=UPI001C710B0C|nr:uncharacterized protein LOC122260750 [Penaeus japonicus]
MGRVLFLYWLIFQCLVYSEDSVLTTPEGALEVNVTIIEKENIRITWTREGPWSNEKDFIVDFKSVGDRPTNKPCTSQEIPCSDVICTLDSDERCDGFGVCRDVGVVITANGYSHEQEVRTDGYTPASVRVDSNGGTLEVSWKGPANTDGDCYAGSVLTISTPWTQYNTSYTEILGQYQHSHSLTAIDTTQDTITTKHYQAGLGEEDEVTWWRGDGWSRGNRVTGSTAEILELYWNLHRSGSGTDKSDEELRSARRKLEDRVQVRPW